MSSESKPTNPKQPDHAADPEQIAGQAQTEDQTEAQTEEEANEERAGISTLQLIQSTLAGALGVQSSKNRKRDFANARASQFVIAGIVFTALFVGIMVLLVRTILSTS